MSQSEQAASRISREYGVHVEYVAVNREYAVDCSSCFGAREAEKMARQIRDDRDQCPYCGTLAAPMEPFSCCV